MGIVNVTPDSFSDGGRFLDPHAAVDHALQLVADGADLLDIGGESTRPYSDRVAVEVELRRVLPVVEALAGAVQVPLSIDTSKVAVAQAALAAGAEIINDITGLQGDEGMVRLASDSCAGICVMHMQGTPQNMQDNPVYADLLPEISDFLAARYAALVRAGIDPTRICLDPGIGFGKTHQQNLTLMTNCWQFHELGCPLLVGHSRKAFLAKITGGLDSDRTAATVGGAISLALQGVQVIRVHDVRAVKNALVAFVAMGGVDGQAHELAVP